MWSNASLFHHQFESGLVSCLSLISYTFLWRCCLQFCVLLRLLLLLLVCLWWKLVLNKPEMVLAWHNHISYLVSCFSWTLLSLILSDLLLILSYSRLHFVYLLRSLQQQLCTVVVDWKQEVGSRKQKAGRKEVAEDQNWDCIFIYYALLIHCALLEFTTALILIWKWTCLRMRMPWHLLLPLLPMI